MKNEKHTSVVRLTSLALLAALIVVLQTVASGIKIGPVPISLTLVPIVVGAILFGPGAGAFLGGVFGVVCLIAGIAGTDQFTNLLWVANPFWLTVVCVGKAVLCGWVAGLVYRALEKRQTLGCIAAAICNNSSRSTDSIRSTTPTMYLTLFVCRCPMKCSGFPSYAPCGRFS